MHDGRHDFDFYFGDWSIRNERLKGRLIGCTDWERFDATQTCRPVLGGVGNLDEFGGSDGFLGMTLRLYDLERHHWNIYWASNRTGTLEPPVTGVFEDGVGTFFGRDVHRGIPVVVRFTWFDITPRSASWDQAFSTDDGQTWETNWRMRMTRRERA